jgi:dTDP-4-amino-4,6-dideoxygalactose transaminase
VIDLMLEGLPVIEDCSHAFGHDQLGGSAHMAVVSLYATKLLGGGEGGMILTDDQLLANCVRDARDYIDKAPCAARLNDKMTDLEAALVLCQLDRLSWALSRRAELAGDYAEALEPLVRNRLCSLPINPPGRVWYRYAVSVDEPDRVVESLARQGVTAARPIENWGGASDATPVALDAFQSLVSLPLYPTLTNAERVQVCNSLASALSTACSSTRTVARSCACSFCSPRLWCA